MKLSELQVGKTYYKKRIDNYAKVDDKHPVQILRYIVVAIDYGTKIVQASVNGAPAEPFKNTSYGRWLDKKPE